jgi:protein phosphatase
VPGAITYACLSDPGRSHAENQDRWLADPEAGLFFVADGMADERPAQRIIERLPALLRSRLSGDAPLHEASTLAQLQAALVELNDEVRHPEVSGSTLVLALIGGYRSLIVHLGDSRAYLLRQAALHRLTTDHSRVQAMLDGGILTPAEADAMRSNGGPTRFIGMWGEPLADVRPLELCPDDRLLLCSDGLTGMLSDADILTIMRQSHAPQDACRRLVAAANAAGGDDNITALVIAVAASGTSGQPLQPGATVARPGGMR